MRGSRGPRPLSCRRYDGPLSPPLGGLVVFMHRITHRLRFWRNGFPVGLIVRGAGNVREVRRADLMMVEIKTRVRF